MNVVEEVVEIRERLARIENSIEHLVKVTDNSLRQVRQIPKEHSQTNVVIPAAVVVAVFEVLRVVAERFL